MSVTVKSFDGIEHDLKKLPLYVVYNSPEDLPGKFIVRFWVMDQPTDYVTVSETLEAARATIPSGSFNIGRHQSDPPQIVEVWV